jgi:hypothetical protein
MSAFQPPTATAADAAGVLVEQGCAKLFAGMCTRERSSCLHSQSTHNNAVIAATLLLCGAVRLSLLHVRTCKQRSPSVEGAAFGDTIV